MPDTTLGLTYPGSGEHVRMYDHLQTLAETADDAVQALITARDAAWSSWTPAITGSTSGGSLGNASHTSRYKQNGKVVHFFTEITLGSTTSMGVGTSRISLPVTARSGSIGVFSGLINDNSAGTNKVVAVMLTATTYVFMITADAASIVTSSAPWTWATSDLIRLSGTYEAA